MNEHDPEIMAKNLDPWDPKAALASLAQERDTLGGHDGETEDKTAERLLRENAPQAALAIVHLAQHSPNDTVRMKAASYVLDRVLGKPGPFGQAAGGADPFQKLLVDCVQDFEQHEGGGEG